MKDFFKKLGRAVTGRKGIGSSMTVAIIIAVVMLNILTYTLTNAFGLYIHTEEKDDLSLSGNTDSLFETALLLDKKVTITFCYPESTLESHSTGQFVLATARAFEERYPELIELNFINLLTKMDEDGNIVDLDKYVEDGRYNLKQSSVIFECGEGEEYSYRVLTDNYTSAGFVDFYVLDSSASIVSYNGEEVMAAMISWVLNDRHQTVYFTQNHGESADISFSNLLTCSGYYVEVINLRKQEIPEDAGMIIISNPTSDFDRSVENATTRGEIDKLEDYLERGGKLYVALDPYVKELKNLESLLRDYGIEMSSRYSDTGAIERDIVRETSDAITTDGYTFVATHADNGISSKILDKVQVHGSNRVLLSNVCALTLTSSPESGLTVYPLLKSGPSSSTFAGGEVTDTSGEYDVAACSVKTLDDGKSATVCVIPTAYITATEAFISEGYSNKDFIYATLEVVFGANPAPYGCRQVLYNTQTLENFTMGRARIYTAIILAIPTALAIVGTVIIVRRKNR